MKIILTLILLVAPFVRGDTAEKPKLTLVLPEPASCAGWIEVLTDDWEEETPVAHLSVPKDTKEYTLEGTTSLGGRYIRFAHVYYSYGWAPGRFGLPELKRQECYSKSGLVDKEIDQDTDVALSWGLHCSIDYQWKDNCTPPLRHQIVPGDLNRDGMVDATDFAILNGEYGKEGEGLLGDLNKDGIVDMQDVMLLYRYWTNDSTFEI